MRGRGNTYTELCAHLYLIMRKRQKGARHLDINYYSFKFPKPKYKRRASAYLLRSLIKSSTLLNDLSLPVLYSKYPSRIAFFKKLLMFGIVFFRIFKVYTTDIHRQSIPLTLSPTYQFLIHFIDQDIDKNKREDCGHSSRIEGYQ